MRPLSYWVSNPDIRAYAIPLVETNMPRRAVVTAIIEKFGAELAPSADEQITKLRMGLAKGKWRTEKISPKGRNDKRMSGTEAAPTTDTTTTASKMRAETPATTRFNWPHGDKTFWDNHPGIMRFAARLIEDEDCNIQYAIEKRFGAKFRPGTPQHESQSDCIRYCHRHRMGCIGRIRTRLSVACRKHGYVEEPFAG